MKESISKDNNLLIYENELSKDHTMRKFGNSEFSTKPTIFII